MFKNLGKIKYDTSDNISKIDLNDLKNGINNLDNFIIYKNRSQIDIYNRVCDHNGGKLITKPDKKIICPLHGWQFDPKSGRYLNNKCEKKQLKFSVSWF